MEEKLELRMYGLVPYNISPIQQAIQFGHAVVEYGQRVKMPISLSKLSLNSSQIYDDWADNWKTFIILNGGTTNYKYNEDGSQFGTLNNHLQLLKEHNVDLAIFNEPDLGEQLTAVVFIVDERIFNKEKYPQFQFKIKNQQDLNNPYFVDETEKQDWTLWVQSIGGWKNLELRYFLQNFRLA